jgi:DNA processing protein
MLIKSNKAAMITSVKDLEYVLGWTSKPLKKSQVQKKLFVEISEDEKRIYDFLQSSEKLLLDQLALETGFSVQKSLMVLLQLELKGMVISHPGKLYQAV